uniref:Uncharacterized protein n=1 Tax=Ditylenchus dipsaci TaxID=166011 RepID=A0A915DE23_9BILA
MYSESNGGCGNFLNGHIPSPYSFLDQEKMTAVKRKAVESLATSTQAILSTAKTGASVYEIQSMPRTATSEE